MSQVLCHLCYKNKMKLGQWLTTLALQLGTWAVGEQRAAWIFREKKAGNLGGWGEEILELLTNQKRETRLDLGAGLHLG